MNPKTTVVKKPILTRKWQLIDLSGQNLGRISTKIAQILMGKHNPLFSYHRDDGDYVVAINASKITVTGKKLDDKIYYHHTGYAGHLREYSLKAMMAKDPCKVINHAVAGMLSKNRLRDKRLSRLKIFAGSEHPYATKISS